MTLPCPSIVSKFSLQQLLRSRLFLAKSSIHYLGSFFSQQHVLEQIRTTFHRDKKRSESSTILFNELDVNNFDVDFKQTQFLALEELTLFRVVARNFNRCSQLKSLNITGFGRQAKFCGWYIQRMPLLVSVKFLDIHDLSDDIFAEFLSFLCSIKISYICS